MIQAGRAYCKFQIYVKSLVIWREYIEDQRLSFPVAKGNLKTVNLGRKGIEEHRVWRAGKSWL